MRKREALTMPMHFFSMLQTLKLFLEIISAGRDFLGHIYVIISQGQQLKRFVDIWCLC